jgi:hypothetical protein
METTTKYYIHLGLIKTGSTFFQREIFPKMRGVSFYHRPNILSKKFDGEKCLLSNEGWCHIPYKVNQPEDCNYDYVFLERLKVIFPDARIIIGVRDEGFVKSLYSRFLLSGCSLSFKEFESRINPEFVNHKIYFDECKRLFDSVFAYQFEKLKKDKKQVIKNLCSFMDVPFVNFTDKSHNVSLKKHQKKMLQILNKSKWLKIPGMFRLFNQYIRKEY